MKAPDRVQRIAAAKKLRPPLTVKEAKAPPKGPSLNPNLKAADKAADKAVRRKHQQALSPKLGLRSKPLP